MWYVLAAANALSGDSELIAGTQLRVPEVGVSKNDASTFKPYNPNEIVGSTSPGLPYIPPPGSNNCAAFAPILTSVILMIAMPYLAPIIQSASSILAGALIIGGATFVANAAATAVGSALGFNTFSWRASLKEGAVAAITAGLGKFDILSKLGPISSLIKSSQFATIAAQTVLNKGIDIAASKMTGVEHAPFSWKDIAIQSVTQAVIAPAANKLSDKSFASIKDPLVREFTTKLATGMITGAAGVAVSRAFGTKAQFNLGAVVGNAFAAAMRPDLAAYMQEDSDQDEQLLIEDLKTPEDWEAYMAENAPDIINSSMQLAFNDPRTSINDKLARMHDWGTMWPSSQNDSTVSADPILFKSVHYEGVYGPQYKGIMSLESYTGWQNLLENGTLTKDELDIISVMAKNEGNLDSLQSWDSQILTAGAMQKTIRPDGRGEFPDQVYRFSKSNPEKYNELFVMKGWTVQEKSGDIYMYYNGITGKQLKDHLRDGLNFRKATKYSEPLQAIHDAITSPEFLNLQAIDFISRLRKSQNMDLGNGLKVSDYFKSKLSATVILDQHVNAPGFVKKDLNTAIRTYLNRNPGVSSNPDSWNVNRVEIERQIIEIYGPNRRGTDMGDRYENILRKY